MMKSPVQENCTPGSVRGQPGNWLFYLDVRQAKLGASCRVKVLAMIGKPPVIYRVLHVSRSENIKTNNKRANETHEAYTGNIAGRKGCTHL